MMPAPSASAHLDRVSCSAQPRRDPELRAKFSILDMTPFRRLCAKGKHVEQTAWRERERQWEEAARLREEQERLRKEETARRAAFRTAAQHWTEAQALRDFHAACVEGLKAQRPDGVLNDRDQRWLDWGMALIRSVDPLTAGYLEKGVAEFPA
jgi:hypothetical protein